MKPSRLEYSLEFIKFIGSNPAFHLLSWYELLWHSIYDRAIPFWHRIVGAIPLPPMTLSKPAMMAEFEFEAANILMDFGAASLLMEFKQQPTASPALPCDDKPPAPPALPCDDKVLDLDSFLEKHTITVSGPVITIVTGQVIGISTYTKTIPIYRMKNHFLVNEAFRARLETLSSTYELRCFLAVYNSGLDHLYGRVEKNQKRSRDVRIALRKPLPIFPFYKVTLERIRVESARWNIKREPVQWTGRFTYLNEQGERFLEKAGRKSRDTRAMIMGVVNMIEECEARLWKVDKDWVIEKRNERPPPRKQRRWREGRPGWTGLTPDDIGPHESETVRQGHKRLRPE